MPVISSATSAKSHAAAAQQGCDALDRDLDIWGRAKFARIRIELKQPPPRIDLARFGKLHADNARRAPHAMPQRPIPVSKML